MSGLLELHLFDDHSRLYFDAQNNYTNFNDTHTLITARQKSPNITNRHDPRNANVQWWWRWWQRIYVYSWSLSTQRRASRG